MRFRVTFKREKTWEGTVEAEDFDQAHRIVEASTMDVVAALQLELIDDTGLEFAGMRPVGGKGE